MPYIRQEKRDILDPTIDGLIDVLRGMQLDDPEDNTESNLNYIISKLLNKLYTADYKEINNALGMLDATKLEYYRRVAAPYENQKRFDNGDVYTLETAEKVVEDFINERDS